MADTETDELYGALRGRWRERARANGYQLESFFLAEQRHVLDALDGALSPVVDVACGSGLMVLPLVEHGVRVAGLDFNAAACAQAVRNGLPVVRGDAYRMPFADESVGQFVNCQFLNQQPDAAPFIAECARVLIPGGRLVITWRHAASWLHRLATIWLTLRRDPAAAFPQYEHPAADMRALAARLGLTVTRLEVTWPMMRATTLRPEEVLARVAGASFLAVLDKPA